MNILKKLFWQNRNKGYSGNKPICELLRDSITDENLCKSFILEIGAQWGHHPGVTAGSWAVVFEGEGKFKIIQDMLGSDLTLGAKEPKKEQINKIIEFLVEQNFCALEDFYSYAGSSGEITYIAFKIGNSCKCVKFSGLDAYAKAIKNGGMPVVYKGRKEDAPRFNESWEMIWKTLRVRFYKPTIYPPIPR
jgi:hypothetical protein